MEAILKSLGLDQYQRSAQLLPAMLTVAPAIATAFLWSPRASAVVTGLVGVTITGALLTLLMQIGRARGRQVQKRIVAKLGGLPSALALRHRDQHVPTALKTRYHAALRKRNFQIPTREEEEADPVGADGVYQSVAGWLPDQTRDKKKFELLHVENRTYGFRRNLLGLKPIGLPLTLLCLATDLFLVAWLRGEDHTVTIAGALLAVVLAGAIAAWLFVVTEVFVEDAGWAYATQQLAASEKLPTIRSAKAA